MPDSTFLRFVRPQKMADNQAREGFFCAAYELSRRPEASQTVSLEVQDLLDWFSANLPVPRRFNRSASKGYYRRNAKGISWFKPDAHDVLAKSFEMTRLLQENGFVIELIRTDRVGYVIYEDHCQVVAEPFADTPV